ncbi:hypothetical protein KSP40_PGU020929 [Platanthera guangdongensis]|uniref:RRM domain-containing protein n=1 Tax=Platanthera guangdongensis TaxID=2320717 RepID=A0ABR2MEB2_9ASPA
MSGSASSPEMPENVPSEMRREKFLSRTREKLLYADDVPPEMREKHRFGLLLARLNPDTSTEVLKSVFGSLPGFIDVIADVDTEGEPMCMGEAVFADEATMKDAAKKMDGQIIDGNKIWLMAA